jgi:hypothetical protein
VRDIPGIPSGSKAEADSNFRVGRSSLLLPRSFPNQKYSSPLSCILSSTGSDQTPQIITVTSRETPKWPRVSVEGPCLLQLAHTCGCGAAARNSSCPHTILIGPHPTISAHAPAKGVKAACTVGVTHSTHMVDARWCSFCEADMGPASMEHPWWHRRAYQRQVVNAGNVSGAYRLHVWRNTWQLQSSTLLTMGKQALFVLEILAQHAQHSTSALCQNPRSMVPSRHVRGPS